MRCGYCKSWRNEINGKLKIVQALACSEVLVLFEPKTLTRKYLSSIKKCFKFKLHQFLILFNCNFNLTLTLCLKFLLNKNKKFFHFLSFLKAFHKNQILFLIFILKTNKFTSAKVPIKKNLRYLIRFLATRQLFSNPMDDRKDTRKTVMMLAANGGSFLY